MSNVQPLKRAVLLPDWGLIVLFVTAVVGSVVTQTVWFIVGLVIVLLVQGFYVCLLARCPNCGGHGFLFRGGETAGADRPFRLHLECRQCHTRFDTGRTRKNELFNS